LELIEGAKLPGISPPAQALAPTVNKGSPSTDFPPSTGFAPPPPPLTSCMFVPSKPCDSKGCPEVAQLKEEVATLKLELKSLRDAFNEYSQSAVQSAEVPDFHRRLFKVENQAAIYWTSWQVLQDSQDLLGEGLKSIKGNTLPSKAPRTKKKTLSDKEPAVFISKVPVSSIKVPVCSCKPQQNQIYRKVFEADQAPTEQTKRIYSKPTLPTKIMGLTPFMSPF